MSHSHNHGNKPDAHSYGNHDRVRVKHARLNLTVDLLNERVLGTVAIKFRRQAGCPANEPLVLDTNGLDVRKVTLSCRNGKMRETTFVLGERHPIFGAPLTVPLTGDTREVLIEYSTTSECLALQWLPERAGRKGKLLFSQGQAILTRSWIPLQDCPAVRMTYEARITVDQGMVAVMSAEHEVSDKPDTFKFKMRRAIPPI